MIEQATTSQSDIAKQIVSESGASALGKTVQTFLQKGTTRIFNNADTSPFSDLEKQTGLLDTQDGINTLSKFKSIEGKRKQYYKAYLLILIQGVEAVGTLSILTTPKKTYEVRITNQHFKKIWHYAQTEDFKLFKTITPAGKSGAFEEFGTEGIMGALGSQRMSTNPMTGARRNTPTLVESALNTIHPKFTETLEKYCVLIKSRAYLALPSMSNGSLRRVVNSLNGIVGAVQKVIFSVYKGVIRAIQQFYAYINGVILKIQNMMMDLIEQIIPLDLICLILEAVQVILDDLNFFGSLFGQGGSFFQFLNTVQNFVNVASNLVSNPFTTLKAYIPADLQKIIDTIDQIGSDPNGFLTDQFSNYGYAYVMNALQGNIVGALVNKYGAQYAAIGPINQLLMASEKYPRGLAYSEPTPASIGPNIYNGRNYETVDENGNRFPPLKIDLAKIINPNNKNNGLTNTERKQASDILNTPDLM